MLNLNKRKIEAFLVNTIAFISGIFILVPFKLKPLIAFTFVIAVILFKVDKSKIKDIIILNFLFISYLFSLFYCQNTKVGLDYLIRCLPLLSLPFCYSFIPNSYKKDFNHLFYKTFIYTTALYVILLFIYMHSLGLFYGKIDINLAYAYITHEFWGLNEHPIYISIAIGISLLLLLLDKKNRNKFIMIPCFFILLIGLLFIARKGVTISFLLICTFFLFKEKIKKEALLIFSIIILFFTISVFIPEVRLRYIELISVNKHLADDESSSSMRIILWQNALELAKESFTLGYSIGDVQEVFNKNLQDKGYLSISKNNMNAHNQYLQILLTSGFIGVFLFILSLIYIIRKLIRNKEYVGTSIVIFFFFCFITESVLYRQNGIILFSLFISSFVLTLPAMEKKKKIVIIGPFPPPISGVGLANEVLAKGLRNTNWNVKVIDTEYSKTLTDTHGKLSLEKLYFLKKYFSVWKIFSSDIVYMTIGQSFFGVIKYLPFIIIGKLSNSTLIVHLNGGHLLNEYNLLKGFKKSIFRKSIKMFDYAIVLSKSLRIHFEPFIKSDNIFELNNFFEDSLIINEKELLEKKNFLELRIVFLSNLIEEKGINVLLAALENLQDKGIKIKLKVAGNKISENDLSKYFNKLELVEYVGVLLGKEKQDLLVWSNVFCLPTFYKMEGQPLSILEAMAMGNLILTTRHSGIPDVCSEENAVFCKKNDLEDIVEKIEFLYNNLEIVKQKSLMNINYSREMFTEKKFIDNANEILEKCMS